ncbi:hypothetical protein [Fontibacillus sp. BL9]|uniref:hypothetical protein n=1 Tax=Fontibacillus sp. BL9 TaxID=3389971 RepID=UPI00397DDA35
MRGIAKAVLISIIVTISFMIFTNFIYFFPWYTTLIVETFNVTQQVASDNYLQKDYKDRVLKKLKDRPIYRDKADEIEIFAKKKKDDLNEHSAEGGDASLYENLPPEREDEKPYRQRGKPVTVTIKATYPLSVTLWGEKYEKDIDLSFSLTTTGLKHYKDLEYYVDHDDWFDDL